MRPCAPMLSKARDKLGWRLEGRLKGDDEAEGDDGGDGSDMDFGLEDGETEANPQHGTQNHRPEQIRLGEGRGEHALLYSHPRHTSFRTRRPTRRPGGLKRRGALHGTLSGP